MRLAGALVLRAIGEAVEDRRKRAGRAVEALDPGGLLACSAGIGCGGDQRVHGDHGGGGACEQLTPGDGLVRGALDRPVFQLCGPVAWHSVRAGLRLAAARRRGGGQLADRSAGRQLGERALHCGDQRLQVAAVLAVGVVAVVVALRCASW